MPSLLVRRDHVVEPVLRLVSVPRRLDADARDETEAVEVAVRPDAARLLCGVARVVGLDAARGFEHGAQFPGRNIRRFAMTGCGAGNGEERPELALGEGAVGRDEFERGRLPARGPG